MRASHRSLLALVAVSSIIAVGCTGSQGPAGNPGPTGPPGSPAPQTGVVAGTVTDAVAAGNPALANVSVTASDSGGGSLGSATTDANGKFSITLPVGVMYLQFALPYYTSPAPLQVG